MRKRDKNLEWSAALEALNSTHTTTIKDICRQLKASRGWVNEYITPHISESKIYLPTGRGEGSNGVNWAYIAAKALNRPDLTEANWYKTEDYLKFIESSISKITRQTIYLPVEMFVKDKEEFAVLYKRYEEKIIGIINEGLNAKNIKAYSRLIFEQNGLWKTMLAEENETVVMAGDCAGVGRSKVEHIPCEINVMENIAHWIAPHDIKGYGDTDEEVFRRFFKHGYYRLEFLIEGKSGKSARKVYYLEDVNLPKHQYVDQYFTMRYDVWKSIGRKLVTKGDT